MASVKGDPSRRFLTSGAGVTAPRSKTRIFGDFSRRFVFLTSGAGVTAPRSKTRIFGDFSRRFVFLTSGAGVTAPQSKTRIFGDISQRLAFLTQTSWVWRHIESGARLAQEVVVGSPLLMAQGHNAPNRVHHHGSRRTALPRVDRSRAEDVNTSAIWADSSTVTRACPMSIPPHPA